MKHRSISWKLELSVSLGVGSTVMDLLLARIGGLIQAFENLVEFSIFPENAVFNDNILNLPKIFGLVLETQEIYLCDHFNHKVDCQQ